MALKTKSLPVRKTRESYKSSLTKVYEENAVFLTTLNSSIQSRLDRIYSAFSGNYAYIDSHSGKTVNARTYKKRLSFVEKEIEGLKKHMALQYKYGVFSEESKSKIENYLASLYSAAITRNDYLKDKHIRRSSLSTQVRQDLQSLGPSIEDRLQINETSRMMRAPTGYTEMFKEQPSTISADVAAPAQRATSSRLYNALISIDADNAKLKEDDLPVWPISREEELRLRERMKNGNKPKRRGFLGALAGLAGFATLAIAGAALFFYSANKSTSVDNSVISSAPIEISTVNPNRLAEPETSIDYSKINPSLEAKPVEYVDKSTLEYESRLKAQGKLTNLLPTTNKEVIEEAKQRVAQAKQQIALEKSKSAVQYTPEQIEERRKLAWEKVRQYESEIAQQKERKEQELTVSKLNVSKSKPIFDWEKAFYRKWEEKSRKRSLENVVVKTVTYYPDGKVIVSYPQINPQYTQVNVN